MVANCLLQVGFLIFILRFGNADEQYNCIKHNKEELDNSLSPVEDDNAFTPGPPLRWREFQQAALEDLGSNRTSFTPGWFRETLDTLNASSVKNAIVDEQYLWPSGVVSYVLDANLGPKVRRLVAKGMADFHKKTCIRFRPRQKEEDFIYVTNRKDKCQSDVGRVGGRQNVYIGPGCYDVATVIHELNHAVGFMHEQNRHDRDKYVQILWDNIQPKYRYNFDLMPENAFSTLNVPYDTNSIMHYDKFAFSIKPEVLEVMVPYDENTNMGYVTALSKNDVKKIRIMYRCAKKTKKPKQPKVGVNFPR